MMGDNISNFKKAFFHLIGGQPPPLLGPFASSLRRENGHRVITLASSMACAQLAPAVAHGGFPGIPLPFGQLPGSPFMSISDNRAWQGQDGPRQ